MTRRKRRPAIATDCKSDTDRMQPLLTANSFVGMPTQSNGLRLLAEADLLLNEGLRRIAGAGDDLPDACNPIEEALALSETQTMNTLEALESAQAAIRRIESVRQGFIDKDVLEIKAAMATILNSQQGQDLAGQRLKKALRLLHAVDDRISQALTSLQDAMGVPRMETVDIASTPEKPPFVHTDAPALDAAIHGKHVEQDDVDALLAELGI
ncbi:protein phosphatase CheZ [Acidithiobacillus ferriphilus]|uniref:protein phosphatase CheZ n=1 Tax=Acidithiobacillus ferriphilus TaxID=1689834 RepID=UPI002330C07C|nr:protein phosphatase CheZ [Acidithiobacillus ferriphilus]WCE93833.1 protein phosphatase CheZ [Acidithiobacillus ferriphilus]